MTTIIFAYEPVEIFVYEKLNQAKQSTYEMVDIFESQAFGMIQFVVNNCYKVQPALSERITEMWDEEWREMFWDIRCQKLRG